jgi:hypothetical protein
MISADVFGRVVRFGEPGFNGSGGGARSGSELSHLRRRVSFHLVVFTPTSKGKKTYMGIVEKECECRTSSLSRDSSLSDEGMEW